jgi:hypothetical protein
MVIKNQDIRDQERGERANLRRFLGIFGILKRSESSRDQVANFKVSNEGIANGILTPKQFKKADLFGDFLAKFVKIRCF